MSGGSRQPEPAIDHPVSKPRILFICGSLNQTTMLHQVARQLLRATNTRSRRITATGSCASWTNAGLWTSRSSAANWNVSRAHRRLPARPRVFRWTCAASRGDYALVVTCSDLLIQRNIRRTPTVLVQEGMTDPETALYGLVRTLGLPRWLAGTAATGLSLAYDRFCVASEGYREFFASKGIPRERMVATGLPNFDDCARHLVNEFPHRGYVLVATSDTRETLKRNDRPQFLSWVAETRPGPADRVQAAPQREPRAVDRGDRRPLPRRVGLRRRQHQSYDCELRCPRHPVLLRGLHGAGPGQGVPLLLPTSTASAGWCQCKTAGPRRDNIIGVCENLLAGNLDAPAPDATRRKRWSAGQQRLERAS